MNLFRPEELQELKDKIIKDIDPIHLQIMRNYWYNFDCVKSIARRFSMDEKNVDDIIFKTTIKIKNFLIENHVKEELDESEITDLLGKILE